MTPTHSSSPLPKLNVAIQPLRAWAPAALALIGVLSLIALGQNIDRLTWAQISTSEEVNQRISYQGIALGMTLVYLVIVYALRPQSFRRFARPGDLNAPAEPVRWLGIRSGERWVQVGATLGFFVTASTAVYLYLNLIQPNGITLETLLSWVPLALVLAASNAFIEEALTRFGVVVGLDGVVSPRTIALVSALIFGIPHIFGVPGGPVGAVMAGVLGWILARSVLETRGVFWAWLLHALQDVVIFATLLSIAA